jgi:hypothetical protein
MIPESNMTRITLLLFINLLVFSNAQLLTKRFFLFTSTSWHDNWLIMGLLIWSQIVLVEVFLGNLGLLRYVYIAAAMAAINVALRAINSRSKGERSFVLVPREIFDFKIELIFISIGLSIFLILSGVNLISPPANWDSLNYHLTFPVERYKNERLLLVITPFADMATTYYPINTELVFLWFLLPLGSITISDVAQAPFVLGGFIAAYSVGRALGFDTRAALWSGILSLFIPMFMINGALWSYNDVAMGTSFVIALYFTLIFVKETTTIHALLCGISSGLFIGTKGVSVIFAIPLILYAWIYVAVKSIRSSKLVPLSVIFAYIVPIVLLGGHTYIRNWIITGNPVYPFNITVGSTVVWLGHVSAGQYHNIPFHEFNFLKTFYNPGYLPCWLSFFVILPLILREIVINRRGLRNPLLLLFYLITSMFSLFCFVVTIRDTRFLIPIQILMCISTAAIIAQQQSDKKSHLLPLMFNIIANITIIIMATVHFMGPEISYPKPLSTTFDASDWPGLISLFRDQRQINGILKYMFLLIVVTFANLSMLRLALSINERVRIILLVALVLFLLAGIKRYDALEYSAYSRFFDGKIWRSWYWLNQRTDGDKIAYVGINIPLPLYGHRLKNDVFYTSINDKYFLHEYTKTSIDYADVVPAWHHRDDANFKIWIRNLLIDQVDFIYTSTSFSASLIEEKWISEHPEAFVLVYNQDKVHIWRINRAILQSLAQSP